jgi:hypothetical protein
MIDTTKLLSIIIEAGAFISAFAAIAAGIMMAEVTKKFGTGILASGFKTNSIGVFCIAIGIIFDAINTYLQVSGYAVLIPQLVTFALLALKYVFFVIGTYIIVIGSKKTGDKIESLTK